MKIKTVSADHKTRANNYLTSPFMERLLERVSVENGKNKNNQVSKSHGLQCLIFEYAKRIGIDIKKMSC